MFSYNSIFTNTTIKEDGRRKQQKTKLINKIKCTPAVQIKQKN